MSERVLRRVGDSGLAVSAIGLGCNNLGRAHTATFEPAGAQALVNAALDAGITLFDTADMYGRDAGRSEELLGRSLGAHRAEVVVATKFGMDARGANGPDDGARGSRRYIRAAVHASLRRLGTDWIDLYQLHEPDPATPLDETLDALDDLVRAGTVRYFGHSNFAGWQLADADHLARRAHRTRFVSAQNEYSLLNRDVERELVPAARAFGVGILPYFPLANGLLTGKYRRDSAPAGSRLREAKPHLLDTAPWAALDALQAFADARDLTMVDVAFGWLLARPQVCSVIAGATSPEQIRVNAAATRYVPTADDLVEIDGIFPPPGV
ncbi:aldo/keto reductase [Nakamurella flavida]|uniref:Aldo/keto reductase n=1 Tax=Nakamurella flavida TaxID=363630 RepID=A0A938YKQ3_9ACTN|nr:aldo/keto reductase [Nakamurella flavida]MBM9477772.1 aldo/keto reductase [Nakamurella flavida]MDP9779325.1 aryl-alcohol dehydrogenase-like predicted oxidoreductase [Nakamurella flavida]